MDNPIYLLIFLGVVILGVAIVARITENKKNKEENDKLSENHLAMMNQLKKIGFEISKNYGYKHFEALVDVNNKMIAFCDKEKNFLKKYVFSELLGCEIIEDNSTIASGGVGRAIVGGLVAGGVGAVVGATTRGTKNVVFEVKLRITSRDINDPLYVIELINEQIERDSDEYKLAMNFAESIRATIESIIKQNN